MGKRGRHRTGRFSRSERGGGAQFADGRALRGMGGQPRQRVEECFSLEPMCAAHARCTVRSHGQPWQTAMSVAQDVSCAVTGFGGIEQQILRLRNSNRENPETLEYLRWRYERAPRLPRRASIGCCGPAVKLSAWRRRSSGPITFMARRLPVAVIGDISVDARYRGRGLGRRCCGS